MINLLPIERVIGLISVVYAVLIALAVAISWRFGDHSQTVWGSMAYAFSGATALQLVLMAWVYLGWKYLWRIIPALNRLLFPDIGGEWDIKDQLAPGGSGRRRRSRSDCKAGLSTGQHGGEITKIRFADLDSAAQEGPRIGKATPLLRVLLRDNLDEKSGGNLSVKRRPVAS